LTVRLQQGTTTPDIVHDLDRAGVAVRDVSVHRPTLDDVFLTLTGHAAEQEDDEAARDGGKQADDREEAA
jgi:ABC-2 type transport system ATP-binding protein